jgi:capsular exopolysaccharide synthesis family protein
VTPPGRASVSGGGAHTFAPSLVMLSNPGGGQAEAIRTLRTNIMAQHLQQGRRALAVCSPSKGAGSTFLAANLAVAMSQIGVKTLLVDGDLRQPSVHMIIRPPRLVDGLRHCLASSDVSFSESIDANILPNLSVMYSGGAAPDPQELLAGDGFRAVMNFCMRDYDMTIIDTPPANTCSDARRVSTVAGYSVIVVERNKTFVNDVKTLSAQLSADHAHVVGTVLNRA